MGEIHIIPVIMMFLVAVCLGVAVYSGPWEDKEEKKTDARKKNPLRKI